jgi:hypothetical protein
LPYLDPTPTTITYRLFASIFCPAMLTEHVNEYHLAP